MNIIVQFAPQDHAIINYTNWEGITADRRIQPLHIWFGVTEYHKTPQFLLHAIDLDKNAERDFAMNDIHNIYVFYNPMSREEWYYHPLSPQKEFFFTYPAGSDATVTEDFICFLDRIGTGSKVEKLPEPSPHLTDFWLNIIKNGESELVQEDYIFDPAAARGAGSKVERLPTEEEARVTCDAMQLNEFEKRMRDS